MAVNTNRRRNRDPKIPHAKELLTDGEWAGRPCVLLGGGPSLSLVMDRLDEFPPETMFAGANQSWRIDPAPSLVYAIDKQVLELAEGKFSERWEELAHRQIRVTNRGNAGAGEWAGSCWLEQISANEWGTSLATGIVAANNTGLGLLNIVDILRADPMILLGYDAVSEGRNLNWHDDYPEKPGWKPKDPEKCYRRWEQCLSSVAGKIRGKVYNANPKSRYEAFEKITFDDALEKCREAVGVPS